MLPSQEELARIFSYDPATGSLRWRFRSEMNGSWNTRFAGTEAGYKWSDDGRRKVEINAVGYFVHRVVWKLLHNEEPPHVDHRSKIPRENFEGNLRPATRAENNQNRRGWRKRLYPLPKGVYTSTNSTKFRAVIRVNKKTICLGNFTNPDEAHAAYCLAAIKYHGEFASLT